MGSVTYSRRRDLRIDVQADGWARVFRPDDEIGLALDPKFLAIYSAARDCTAREVGNSVGVSNYLASSALAVLSHAGLISSEPPPPHPSSTSSPPPVGNASVSALVVHHHPRGALDTSVGSVLNQGYPALNEIVVLAGRSTSFRERGVRVVRSYGAGSADSLIEQLHELTGDAFLLLDSRVSLAPGALEEMVYTLELRSDIAAVAPRIMWTRWPRFVVGLGDWGSVEGASPGPYTGYLDVDQFERWQEVPAISSWAGLISRRALRQTGHSEGEGAVTPMNDWCLQARLNGNHIVAATRALAYGPWLATAELSGEDAVAAQNVETGPAISDLVEQLLEIPVRCAYWPEDLPLPKAGAVLHESRPALTIEGLRGLYSHYRLVTPLPIRRRVAFVAQESSRHRRLAQQLSRDCEVNWISSCEAEDEQACLFCREADLLITTADSLMRCGCLQKTGRPTLLDTQSPAVLADGTAGRDKKPLWKQALEQTSWDWLEVVDGIVCASEEERSYWLGALAARDRLNPYVRSVDRDLRDLVMVVPTGVEVVTPPPHSVLKGVHPGVDAEDKVILWYGPLRAFDDPITAIYAFEALSSSQDHLKLLFAAFGNREEDAETLRSAMQLVKDLGLTEGVLFERQLPRHLRDGYLCEADLAVALGKQMLEAQLSGPVALSACIGAGLPMIVTDGHAGSHLTQRYALGQTVSAYDVEAVSDALSTCLERPRDAYSEAFAKAKPALAWSQVTIPVVHFCHRPHYALDRLVERFLLCEAPTPPPAARSLLALLLKAWRTHQEQGLRQAIREMRQYIRWKAGI